MTKESIEKQLVIACQEGNLEQIIFLSSYHLVDLNYNDNEPIKKACENNHLDIVKFITNESSLNLKNCFSQSFLNDFINTTQNFDLLKYIIVEANFDLTEEIRQAILKREDAKHLLNEKERFQSKLTHEKDLRNACKNGDLLTVKQILIDVKKIYDIDIHANEEINLKLAGMYGHLDIIKFLLTSPDLLEHSNIYYNEFKPLKSWVSYCKDNRHEIFNFLLTEYNLIIDKPLQDFIDCCPELSVIYRKAQLDNNLSKNKKCSNINKI